MKTKKTILMLITLSVMAIFSAKAQTPGFEWATQTGGDSLIQPKQIAVDLDGNQIITGIFRGTADFNPSPDVTFNLISNGLDDIFIQKLGPDGNLIWAASMGDEHRDVGFDVVTDDAGNIYMTGWFWGTIDADPGPGNFELSQTKNTAFVMKIDPDGDLIWAKQMGFPGDWGLAYGYAIAVDNSLNVITTGMYYGRVDFDPGDGTFNLSSSGHGGGNVFIQKLDASGNFVWAKQVEGREYNYGYAVAADASGNIYTSGYFKGTADFNPDPKKKIKYNLTSKGDYDAFVLKLTGNGDFVWAKQIGGTESNLSYSLAIDPTGYLYSTGYFYGTADFNPGTGTYNMTSLGNTDAYILKLDLSGNFVWAKQIGGSYYDGGSDIKLDGGGNFYVSGYFYFTTDFDPGSGTHFLTANGHDDSFVAKFNNSGNFTWAIQTGGPGWDYSMSMALDASGNIFNVGNFQQTADFNPDGNDYFGMTNADASGGEGESESDMFVQKLNSTINNDCPVPNGLTATAIEETSATLGWNAVTGSGGYYVRYREIATDWIEVTDIVSGTSLSLSGLTIATAYEFQVKTDCFSNYSYSFEFITSGGGCADNYEPNESMAAAASIPVNTDIEALISVSGDLDWFKFNNSKKKKNIQITLTNLPANYDVALYDADGNQLGISQNTGTADEIINYNTRTVGTYYVKVYGSDGEYDPSSCYTLVASIKKQLWKSAVTGVNNDEESMDISVYPNPASTILNISLSSPSDENITVRFTDISGKTFRTYNFTAVEGMNQYKINLDDFRNGLYFIGLTKGSNRFFRKVLIHK